VVARLAVAEVDFAALLVRRAAVVAALFVAVALRAVARFAGAALRAVVRFALQNGAGADIIFAAGTTGEWDRIDNSRRQAVARNEMRGEAAIERVGRADPLARQREIEADAAGTEIEEAARADIGEEADPGLRHRQ